MLDEKGSIVFGVAGGTASGKTTVADAILDAVGAAQVAYLPHDAYYREMNHLPFSERAALNYDHPDSLESELLISHIEELLAGRPVQVQLGIRICRVQQHVRRLLRRLWRPRQ